jgi:hypothetical protein
LFTPRLIGSFLSELPRILFQPFSWFSVPARDAFAFPSHHMRDAAHQPSPCHRGKDYGNWNKNEPIFKLPVFIYLTRKFIDIV